MIRPRSWREWLTMLVVAGVVAMALVLPMYVIRTVHDDTERILARVEAEAIAANERAIRVNVLTISCLVLIPPEERTEQDLERCIREGFSEIQDEESG